MKCQALSPVPLNPEHLNTFSAWRKEFPRPEPVAQPKPNPDPTSVIDSNDVVAKVGSNATADELSTSFKHEIIKEVDLPPGGSAAASHIKLCLTAAVGANKTKHVWLHNASDKVVSLPPGTFLGRGGPGNFLSLVKDTVPEERLPFSWRYTRLTGYNKDNAQLANGYMIFNKAGTPLHLGEHKMVCFSDIETVMGNNLTQYGHAITRGGTKVTMTPSVSPVVWVPSAPAVGGESSPAPPDFSADTLGAFLPSHDCTSGVPKYAGMVRGVF